jgi:hypothetical protein
VAPLFYQINGEWSRQALGANFTTRTAGMVSKQATLACRRARGKLPLDKAMVAIGSRQTLRSMKGRTQFLDA